MTFVLKISPTKYCDITALLHVIFGNRYYNVLIFVSQTLSNNAGTTKFLTVVLKMSATKYCDITALLDVISETGITMS